MLADLILFLHFGLVVFVVGGLVLVALGNLVAWRWVNQLCFRLVHLLAITLVVAESRLGLTCPLTTLESWLRTKAGAAPYRQSFIEHWV